MTTLADFKDCTKLTGALLEGETILWKGCPERFPLVSEKNKKRIYTRWIACAVAFVAALAIYLIVLSNMEAASFNIVLVLILALVCGYVALIPALDKSKVIRKCRYYVTDQRVLLAYNENEIFALPRKGLKVARVPAEDGCVTLLFGSHTALSGKKLLTGAFLPGKDEGGEEVTGIEFYNIADSEAIRELFPG